MAPPQLTGGERPGLPREVEISGTGQGEVSGGGEHCELLVVGFVEERHDLAHELVVGVERKTLEFAVHRSGRGDVGDRAG